MRLAIILLVVATACGSSSNPGGVDGSGGGGNDGSGSGNPGRDGGTDGTTQSVTRTIFIVPMENESSSVIYGNTTYAPYINNTLIPMGAQAMNFTDELPSSIPSEPHYVWMEAGTNTFSDKTFTTDSDASASNSTNSTAHLVTEFKAAGVTWMSYQEGMTAGTCPVSSIGGTYYAAKHDPFVFFQDVSGATPSSGNAYCAAHHKPYAAFAADLAAGNMPAYVFITPNLCHDMHGATGCPSSTTNGDIQAGDTWLSNELPRIIAYANAHNGVVYLTWDEGSSNQKTAFLAFGPHIKTGQDTTAYTHSSLVKSIAEQLGVAPPSVVSNASDFAPMFESGYFQ
jgi:phosphatidylinositol-3-phosphatase